MNLSSPRLKEYNLIKTVLESAKKKKKKLYLVGGILRDMLLNRDKKNLDFDFCLRKGAIGFGRKLAEEVRAGFVVLDKEHGACRLVKKMDTGICTLDFSDFREKTIEGDLRHRDFTINALALELEKNWRWDNKNLTNLVIDPYGGREDLRAKRIRFVNKKGFDEDPLRILRAFSLSAILGFKIDKETLKLIKLKANKLPHVSFERIRDELFKILDGPNSFDYFIQLDKLKILPIIIPEIEEMRGVKQGPYHHLDVLRHSLETIRQFEYLIEELKNNSQVQDYLDEIISGQRKRSALIKLGALLHDIGKPSTLRREGGKTKFHGHERKGLDITRGIARRLRLSNDELTSLEKMVFWHLRPGYLADNEEITARARFRYFRDAAEEAVSILLISISDQRSTRGRLTSKTSRIYHEKVALNLIKEYFRRKQEKRLPRLVTGHDLLNKFKLEPSPLIGKILSEIEELQAIGKIKSKKEALVEAKRMIKKR
ncbi:MAG: HD domain-containing protein [Candidatus Omnitrophica bacterium]|nr:HD domain-containing protein [Candidatus Omnitrophota bacterium]MBU4472677.1 HD domain-containing protein [Candidatus Omnitrophota bacterium]MCG2706716.1 HD domain-containing protein [Candidatus Omnitrophota bacterium]